MKDNRKNNTEEKRYSDFSNVEDQRNFLASEEFPEGSFGQTRDREKPVQNKETPWHKGQQYTSGFVYEDRTLHQELPRQYSGAHPTHDDPANETEPPYDDSTP
ncbi:hypothetical protein GCM10011391_29180 [Pullulanibacillus camelliae]|uniref:Cytosolic protein n=1 Tax=Pullulanibacillus camelliae TaxID=1707096 RepID=A0A8J2YJQ8_9BACL|nr:cytosolic protein [Pullulanibacillus camelliae]GGE48529.1 hypothetical protein GCM10011391_29180 [Pullulanibacillus camelliae]